MVRSAVRVFKKINGPRLYEERNKKLLYRFSYKHCPVGQSAERHRTMIPRLKSVQFVALLLAGLFTTNLRAGPSAGRHMRKRLTRGDTWTQEASEGTGRIHEFRVFSGLSKSSRRCCYLLQRRQLRPESGPPLLLTIANRVRPRCALYLPRHDTRKRPPRRAAPIRFDPRLFFAD